MKNQILKKKNIVTITASAAILFATGMMTTASQEFAETPLGSNDTITVTTLHDVTDFSGAQQVGDLPGPDGHVSFREAVAAANNTAGPQTIAFAISPAEFWLVQGVALLELEEGAFFLTDSATTIDFSTQTTNIGDTNPNGPEVGIYGLQPNGWGIAAIFLNGNNCVIKGLGNVYQRGYAAQLVGNNNRVIGCQIDGPLHAAISVSGYIGGPTPTGNIIGGTVPGEGNILINLNIDGPADNNIVIGNPLLVGVQVRGATQYGVFAHNNRIGGPTAAERNVISGFGRYGEEGFPTGSQVSIVDTDGTIVEGNYIGTTADGMARYPQQIGPGGVEVRDARGTTIRGNLIAGLRTVGINHYAGQIFGVAVSVGAINADIHDTVIEGNTIGLAADGVTQIVTHQGVVVAPYLLSRHAFDTLVATNHIAKVEKDGVFVGSTESGVTITRNSIHDNGELGIDLSTGGNHQQSFPTLQSAATTGSSVTVQGTLDSAATEQFTIEFFASPSCDPSGFGEGATFLGSTLVTTDGGGHATFSQTFAAPVAVGTTVTATATRLSTGDSSQFSACITVTPAGAASPSPSPSPGTSPSPSPSPSPGVSPSPSPSPSPGVSPSPSPSPSPGVSPSPSPSPSPGVSPSPSPSPSPGTSPSPSPSPSPGTSPSPSPSPSPGTSPSPSPSPIPASSTVNLSTRVRVQNGDNAGIGGFIITGSAPKHVLIRAIGPSLAGFGVPDALANPTIELNGPDGFIKMANDNWRDTQEVAIQATGIAPVNDFESAIDTTLAPGAYTAVVRGSGNTAGVALIEVYDLGSAVPAKLANISTRAFVSSGDDIVIAGFILSGNPAQASNARIIVRGIGPSLTSFGVPDALANPTLELRDNNGALLLANNDWQDDPAQAAELTAAGLAPTNQLESGITATLPPGAYTVLLAGVNSGTGIGVVEVYDRGAP